MKEKLTFEEAMRKLEEILREMESGELTLDGSVKAYEEASRLIAICRGSLDDCQRKITQLKSADGEITETELKL